MSFNEVKILRHEGKLDEAYEMAKQEFDNEPDNLWNKRSLSWVLYDYVKVNSNNDKFDQFISYLDEIIELDIPEEESMFFENIAWQIAKLVFSIHKIDQANTNKIQLLFNKIQSFHFKKPSESYSMLFKSFLQFNKTWPGYIDFMDWWNISNFRQEDFTKETLPNGKEIISLAERAYIAYARKLIELKNEFGKNFKEKTHVFLTDLNILIDKHPEYQYPSYFKAKLLLLAGEGDEGLNAFLPFARKKRNDFWIWDLLAEFYKDDETLRIACISKGLLCKTSDDFLVKLHDKLANYFISKGFYDKASVEIKKIIETRTKNNWKIDGHLLDWINADWYKSNPENTDNKKLYKTLAEDADEVLFKDIEEEIIVVEFVNKHRKVLNFIIDRSKHGFFKYERYLDKVEIGDVLKVRFDGEGKDDYYKVFTVKQTDEMPDNSIIKEFSGIIRRRENQSFAFVEDIFFDQKLVESHQLLDGIEIKGKAIISFNKKKNEWGWKCYSIYDK